MGFMMAIIGIMIVSRAVSLSRAGYQSYANLAWYAGITMPFWRTTIVGLQCSLVYRTPTETVRLDTRL